ncbi:hypothetical protein SDC9_105277 [bioreactor metagenome]|uniref:Uncharacterized protein n=1 Tax=bioreactor metagenome TaxID=1076179 RepID=A0A645B072_9ZZZZ
MKLVDDSLLPHSLHFIREMFLPHVGKSMGCPGSSNQILHIVKCCRHPTILLLHLCLRRIGTTMELKVLFASICRNVERRCKNTLNGL